MSYYDKHHRTPHRPIGWRIFWPLLAFLLLAAAYSAYWMWAKHELSRGIDGWIEAERARGMVVEYSDKRMGGYPFRFTLTLDDPAYADPRANQRWEGETLQLAMQPWDWQHVIARSPGENRIFDGGLEGWARLGPKSAGSLTWSQTGIERVSIDLDEIAFDLAGELSGTARDFELHLRQYPGEPETVQLETHWQALRFDDMIPGADILGTDLGPSILRAEATHALPVLINARRPESMLKRILGRGGEIRVPQAQLDWGPLDAGAQVRLKRERGEGLSGLLGLRLENAEALREALEGAGRLDEDTRAAINALEAASADGRFLELSVRSDGLYLLGTQVVPLDLRTPLG